MSSNVPPSISTEGLQPHEIATVFASVRDATAFGDGVGVGVAPSPKPPKPPACCGCTLPLKVAVVSKTCPICQTPIGYIRDGLVGKRPSVLFKYNKLVVSLSVLFDVAAPSVAGPQPQPSTSLFSWQSLVPIQRINTAQGRIASVLELSAIKILCKGKVVYPSTTLTEEQVSQHLLNLSSSSSPTTTSASKVQLLVMGTAAGKELQLASYSSSHPTSLSLSSVLSSLPLWLGNTALGVLQWAARWSFRVLVFGIQWAQQTLRRLYATAQSLLLNASSSTATINNNHNSSNNNNNPRANSS